MLAPVIRPRESTIGFHNSRSSRAARQQAGKDFQRHYALQAGLDGFVDVAHASLAQMLHDGHDGRVATVGEADHGCAPLLLIPRTFWPEQARAFWDAFPPGSVLVDDYLPLLDQPADPEPGRTEEKPPQGGAETILLVEDEDMLRTLTRNVLELLGYTVLEAANGKHACTISEQQAAPIDLLLTDVVMPGMNGPALAQRLMASRPGLKILYTSGYTGQGVGQGVLPEVCHFIPKPFTREDLARKIREALDDSVLPLDGVHDRRAENSVSQEAQS